MSMENAILAHAAAIDNLSAAIRDMYANRGRVLEDALKTVAGAGTAELIEAVDGKAATGSKKTTKGKADAELEKAVEKVEADAVESKRATEPEKEDAPAELDYVKDVRPTLLAAIKKVGKETVKELINTFGEEKAENIKPDQLGKLLAGAKKLAA